MATHDQLVEYKVIPGLPNLVDMSDALNREARQGWRVINAFHSDGRVNPTIILERLITLGVNRD